MVQELTAALRLSYRASSTAGMRRRTHDGAGESHACMGMGNGKGGADARVARMRGSPSPEIYSRRTECCNCNAVGIGVRVFIP